MASVEPLLLPDIGDFAEVEVIELLVAPGDHVDLGHRDVAGTLHLSAHIVHRHRIRSRSALLRIERAELAPLIADVGVVDMLVTNVVGIVAVPGFADDIGERTDRV